jgi:GMP synthase (glutamine-hydrolysing)
VIEAQDQFFEALKGVADPETKRKIIGEKFIRVFETVAKEEGIEYLIQGTIAPDWIESGGELRDRIKSHHNVGGLPKEIDLKIVEPLRDIYKDEVRKLANFFGVEAKERQPFPGPGLAVRIIGEVTKENVEIVREANAIMEEEIEKAYKESKISKPWQYFATLLPVKTVGVHGDVRNYGYVIALRSVESIDGMSASYSKIPHSVLDKISIRITNTLGKKVNRVVYDLTNKPPGTIEFE